MSGRRPQRVAERGQRVVLVIPRAEPDSRVRIAVVLDNIAKLGWTVSAIIDPAQHLDALRMVLKGFADVVVAVDPDHLPSLMFAHDLAITARGRSVRTARVLRPGVSSPVEPPAQRRPQPIWADVAAQEDPAPDPEPIEAEIPAAESRRAPVAPEPVVAARRRASQSHHSGAARARRSRA